MKQEYDLKWLFDNLISVSASTGSVKDKKVYIEISYEIFKKALDVIKDKDLFKDTNTIRTFPTKKV